MTKPKPASVVARRPPKKQAVTRTRDLTTKALIRRNAAESPLLRIPSEVREKILVNVIGQNLIHIRFYRGHELDFLHEASVRQWSEGTLQHAICVSKYSEKSAYEEVVSGHVAMSERKSAEHFPPSCTERHNECALCGDEVRFGPREDRLAVQLDLRVLGASRQLYEEANYLLWATNTFSFDDSVSFDKFLASLNPAQKRNLAKIHIRPKIYMYSPGKWSRQKWTTAFKMPYLNMLHGVKHLHFCFEHHLEYYNSVERDVARINSELDRGTEPFMRFRVLPNKEITVILDQKVHSSLNDSASLIGLTAAEKKNWAERFRIKLVDPNGAALVKADADAQRAQDLLTSMDWAKTCAARGQKRAVDTQARANRKRAKAQGAVTAALRAVARAKIAEDRGDENAFVKRDLAAHLEYVASGKEERAAYAEGLAAKARRIADEKSAKHERAVARVETYNAKHGIKMNEANPGGVDQVAGISVNDSMKDEDRSDELDSSDGSREEGNDSEEDMIDIEDDSF